MIKIVKRINFGWMSSYFFLSKCSGGSPQNAPQLLDSILLGRLYQAVIKFLNLSCHSSSAQCLSVCYKILKMFNWPRFCDQHFSVGPSCWSPLSLLTDLPRWHHLSHPNVVFSVCQNLPQSISCAGPSLLNDRWFLIVKFLILAPEGDWQTYLSYKYV